MADFPTIQEQQTPLFIYPWTEWCVGLELRQLNGTAVPASFTWTANQAVYIPFAIPWPYPVRRVFWYNGTAVVSNVDFGIYTEGGARIYSQGSTAQSGASAIQYATVSTPFILQPGKYYMAYNCSGTTNVVFAVSQNAAQGKILGLLTQAVGAVALPNPATFATYAGVGFPVIGFTRTASGF